MLRDLHHTRIPIELLDQGVDLIYLTLNRNPIIAVIPLGYDLLVGFPLLLDPGEVLEIMDTAALGVG
jgi:hypothetical protein